MILRFSGSLLINGRVTIVGSCRGVYRTESVFHGKPAPARCLRRNHERSGGARNSSLTTAERPTHAYRPAKPGVTAKQRGLEGLAANFEAVSVEQKDRRYDGAAQPVRHQHRSIETTRSRRSARCSAMAAMVLLVACLNLANVLLAAPRGAKKSRSVSRSVKPCRTSGSFSPKALCCAARRFADCSSAFGLPICSSPRSAKFCRWMSSG